MSPQEYGIIVLVLSNIGWWGREWLKHRNWKSKNGQSDVMAADVKEIKKETKAINNTLIKTNLSMARVQTEVKKQNKHCEITVKSVFKEIGDNRNKIFNLAKEK